MKYQVTRIQIKGDNIDNAFWFGTYNKDGIDYFFDGGLIKDNRFPKLPHNITIHYKQEKDLLNKAYEDFFKEQKIKYEK